FNEDQHSCVIVVPDYQLSLAIGKRGQNVRLAAKLTGFKIDIKSESDMEAMEQEEEELKDDSFFDALNENAETVSETDESTLLAEDLVETSTEETMLDEDYETGELSPEESEDIIEFAEERDGKSE